MEKQSEKECEKCEEHLEKEERLKEHTHPD
jgi:hypothetical protein